MTEKKQSDQFAENADHQDEEIIDLEDIAAEDPDPEEEIIDLAEAVDVEPDGDETVIDPGEPVATDADEEIIDLAEELAVEPAGDETVIDLGEPVASDADEEIIELAEELAVEPAGDEAVIDLGEPVASDADEEIIDLVEAVEAEPDTEDDIIDLTAVEAPAAAPAALVDGVPPGEDDITELVDIVDDPFDEQAGRRSDFVDSLGVDLAEADQEAAELPDNAFVDDDALEDIGIALESEDTPFSSELWEAGVTEDTGSEGDAAAASPATAGGLSGQQEGEIARVVEKILSEKMEALTARLQPRSGAAASDGAMVSPDQLEESLKRIVEETFATRIEQMLVAVIEKAVGREIEKLRNLLIDEAAGEE